MHNLSELRVLLVSRRYWPCCDDGIQRLMLLAEGLRRNRVKLSILSSRQSSSWTQRFVHREIPVERPFDAPRSVWSIPRYTKSLNKWFDQNASQFNVVYVDAMREDAGLIVKTLAGGGPPVIVRCGGTGDTSDPLWWQNSRAAMKSFRASMGAAAFIAPRATLMQQMIAQGIAANRIHRIDDGIPNGKRVTANDRRAARRSLASLSQDMRLDDDAFVVLLPMRLTSTQHVYQMLDSIAQLLRNHNHLHFWVTSNRSSINHAARDKLDSEVRRRSMVGDVVPLASFDHLDDLVDAVNLVVATTDSDLIEGTLPMAISRGVPTLLGHQQDLRSVVGNEHALTQWFNPDRPEEFVEAIQQAIVFNESASRNADQLRQRIAASGSEQRWIEAHYRLMSDVAQRITFMASDPLRAFS